MEEAFMASKLDLSFKKEGKAPVGISRSFFRRIFYSIDVPPLPCKTMQELQLRELNAKVFFASGRGEILFIPVCEQCDILIYRYTFEKYSRRAEKNRLKEETPVAKSASFQFSNCSKFEAENIYICSHPFQCCMNKVPEQPQYP